MKHIEGKNLGQLHKAPPPANDAGLFSNKRLQEPSDPLTLIEPFKKKKHHMPGFDINWKIPETSGIARVKFIELQLLLHHQLLGAWQRWLPYHFFSDQDVSAEVRHRS